MESIAINELTPSQINGLVAGAISVGTLYCFLGYRTLKILIALTGFFIAGMTAATLAGLVSEGEIGVMGLSGLIGGLFGAMALAFLYRTGIFLIGVLGASLTANNLFSAQPESWVPLAIIGVGLLGGLVALLIERPVITLSSAVIGAWVVVSGVAYFVYEANLFGEISGAFAGFEQRNFILTCWAVLAVAGTIAQFVTRKRPLLHG